MAKKPEREEENKTDKNNDNDNNIGEKKTTVLRRNDDGKVNVNDKGKKKREKEYKVVEDYRAGSNGYIRVRLLSLLFSPSPSLSSLILCNYFTIHFAAFEKVRELVEDTKRG